MAINTYSTLQTAIESRLDRGVTADYADLVDLAESRLYDDLLIRDMKASISATMSGGVVTIPTDFIEAINFYINGTPVRDLQQRSPAWIIQRYPNRSADAKPYYFADNGSSFIFGPYPDDNYILQGEYYARYAALSASNETNWFTDNTPDILFYAILSEAGDHFDDEREAKWEAKYKNRMMRIKKRVNREKRGSGPQRTVSG